MPPFLGLCHPADAALAKDSPKSGFGILKLTTFTGNDSRKLTT
jgi:hypothetical protein